MKFVYIGSENDPPTETTVFGYEFTLNGPPVDVNEAAGAKLRHNRTFKAVEATTPQPRAENAPTRVIPDDMASEVDPVAVLTAAGVKVDGRWGQARIRAELERVNGTHG